MSSSPSAGVVSRFLKNRATTLAFFLGIAGSLGWWAALPPDTAEIEAPKGSPPALEAENVRSIIVRKDGKKLWEVAARDIAVHPENSRATATGVYRGTLYHDGQPVWELKAGKVTLDQASRDVDAREKVTAAGPHQLQVQTRRAVWKNQAQKLVCPEPIRATVGGLTIDTKSAGYDLAKDELRCVEGVKVSSKYGTLDSAMAVARPQQQIVEFPNGVNITIPASNLPQPGESKTPSP